MFIYYYVGSSSLPRAAFQIVFEGGSPFHALGLLAAHPPFVRGEISPLLPLLTLVTTLGRQIALALELDALECREAIVRVCVLLGKPLTALFRRCQKMLHKCRIVCTFRK